MSYKTQLNLKSAYRFDTADFKYAEMDLVEVLNDNIRVIVMNGIVNCFSDYFGKIFN